VLRSERWAAKKVKGRDSREGASRHSQNSGGVALSPGKLSLVSTFPTFTVKLRLEVDEILGD